ncbi:MAG: hypothetical protein ACRDL2_14900 [Gaiellaceae bacterium]
MEAQPISETSQRWKMDATAYRVFFWRAHGNLKPRAMHIGVGYSSETFELTGVRDVTEALDWANANAQGRTFTLYVVDDRDPGQTGLIQLFGINPTDSRRLPEQREAVGRLFRAHGYSGEPQMHPVTTVDERAFVVTSDELAAMTDVPSLIAELERVLEAPVRIETTLTRDVFDPDRP